MQPKCNGVLRQIDLLSTLNIVMSKENPTVKDDGYEIHAGYRIRLRQADRITDGT